MLQQKRRVYTGLDVCKVLCCTLIAASHLPSFFSSEVAEAFFKQWFIRFCVPFFFACSGFFFQKSQHKGRSILRIAVLTAAAYLLYMPEMMQGVQSLGEAFSRLRWNLVVGYEHLWYLNATLEGMIIWYALEKLPVIRKLFQNTCVILSLILLLLGAVLDEYYPLLDIPLVNTVGNRLLDFGGPRNVVFIGLPLLVLGGAAARYEALLQKIPTLPLLGLWVLLRGLAFFECWFLLTAKGFGITNDITFFGCLPGILLLLIGLRVPVPVSAPVSKLLRKIAEYVYILHPLAASLLTKCIPMEPLVLWIATIAVSSMICLLVHWLCKLRRT